MLVDMLAVLAHGFEPNRQTILSSTGNVRLKKSTHNTYKSQLSRLLCNHRTSFLPGSFLSGCRAMMFRYQYFLSPRNSFLALPAIALYSTTPSSSSALAGRSTPGGNLTHSFVFVPIKKLLMKESDEAYQIAAAAKLSASIISPPLDCL